MTQTRSTQTRSTHTRQASPAAARRGLRPFAAVVLLIAGFGQATMGVTALVGAVTGGHGDAAALSPAAWTVLHLTLGTALAVAGVGVLGDAPWARPAAVSAAIGAVVTDFVWSPSAPVLSVALIALAIVALWALGADDDGAAT